MLSNNCKFSNKFVKFRNKRSQDKITFGNLYHLFQNLLPKFKKQFNLEDDLINSFRFADAHYFCDVIASYNLHKTPLKENWTP